MSAIEYRFIEPLDILFLRSNKLFGDPGSFGESLIPPWPSVAAGAIRSRMLVDDKFNLSDFSKGSVSHPTFGTPQHPGSFAVKLFQLARHNGKNIELLVAPPADLIISNMKEQLDIRYLKPTQVDCECSSLLPLLPVFAQNERSKPIGGFWLTQTGWKKYLQGEELTKNELIESSKLWSIDSRVGLGLAADTRSISNGKLFTSQAIAMCPDVGFLVGISGAKPPDTGMLRFGGDGRAAAIHPATINLPRIDYEAIAKSRRCRIVLTTPGLFPLGWKLPGTDADNHITIDSIQARLACASVPRFEVISGWDLAKMEPKTAQRVAPAGSVYWLDELDATEDALCKLMELGLWDNACEDLSHRRAEGFNQFTFAAY